MAGNEPACNGHSSGNSKHESAATPMACGEGARVTVEVCLKPLKPGQAEPVPGLIERVQQEVSQLLESSTITLQDGPLHLPAHGYELLREHVHDVALTDPQPTSDTPLGSQLCFWQIQPDVRVFRLCSAGPKDAEAEGEEGSPYKEWELPAQAFHGLWDTLVFETDLKARLMAYTATALLFSDRGLQGHLVSINRTVLLHGPPGTGKTSICKALAQRLAIKFAGRWSKSCLIEVNSHSLFSKWFSESGKLVAALFQRIQTELADRQKLVFVLIDEVESLTAARQAAMDGGEPADSIRAVNALLTALDGLKNCANAMVLFTTNMPEAVDTAFLDRADIKVLVGPPGLEGRYAILHSCVGELQRVGLLSPGKLPTAAQLASELSLSALSINGDCAEHPDQLLRRAAELSAGLSGRTLRKLPVLAFARLVQSGAQGAAGTLPLHQFLHALVEATDAEQADRTALAGAQ